MNENLPAIKDRMIPSDHEMTVYNTMAKQANLSKMYRNIGDESGIAMVMLAGREMGISPMMALNGGLNIIQGKVEISARMMNALIRKAGHSITIKESTDQICTIIGTRADNKDVASVSYTFAEAQKAGLVKPSGGWVKCPKDMCFARALSRLARQLFPDVIGIGYIEGEISQSNHVPIIEEVAFEEVIAPMDIEEMTKNFISLFSLEDEDLCKDYLKVVCGHFKWTLEEALTELLKDKDRLVEKFNGWKEKQKAKNEKIIDFSPSITE